MDIQPLFANQKTNVSGNWKIILLIVAALVLFLFSIDLLISALHNLSGEVVQVIIQATSNPFTGLFIGLFVTAVIQSSTITTASVVALVASGAITLPAAIPIIMGANVGTTITSIIVSLGFIQKKKEFRRAVAAGSYHCFFNILTVVIIFPLEYNFKLLTSTSSWIVAHLFRPSLNSGLAGASEPWSVFGPIINFLMNNISGAVLVILSFSLLFFSILFFRKQITALLKSRSPETFSRFFFKNRWKSFGWGLLVTAGIRSSTITTSLVVPIVAKKITTLKQAAPYIMGANIGTTITALIAAVTQSNTASAMSIGIAHCLFNATGVLFFFFIPALQKLPVELANALGRMATSYRVSVLIFLLVIFFIIPFSLIYMSQ